jgi:hypothetical protein
MSRTQSEIYKDGSITSSDLASNSVTEPKIMDEAVTMSKLKKSIRPQPFSTRGFNLPI